MKILFQQTTHISKSQNGASVYNHNLAKALIAEGYSVIACCDGLTGDVLFDGVAAVPFHKFKELYEWADLIITTPGKLRNNPLNKAVVFVQHNTGREPFDMSFGRVVYCAKHVADVCQYTCKDSRVFWPMNRYAGCDPLPENPGGRITLINCNPNKGGRLLPYFAKKLPQYEFLGLHGGYGYQHKEEVDNLMYATGHLDLPGMLSQSSILIMPSEKEGLPTLAMEAMSLGVPVVGSAIPAFVELRIRDSLSQPKDYFVKDIELAMENYFELREKQLSLINEIEAKRDVKGFINWLTQV